MRKSRAFLLSLGAGAIAPCLAPFTAVASDFSLQDKPAKPEVASPLSNLPQQWLAESFELYSAEDINVSISSAAIALEATVPKAEPAAPMALTNGEQSWQPITVSATSSTAEVTESAAVVELVDAQTGQPLVLPRSAGELFDDASTLVGQASPGQRTTSGLYVALSPSLVFGYDINFDGENVPLTVVPLPGAPPVTADVPVDASIDTETGYGISGAVGYRFSDARAEFEIGYNYNSVDSVTVNDVSASVDGSISSWQFLVNGYYDIPTNSGFRPYVGGGIGLSILSADDVSATVPQLGEVDLEGSGASFVFQFKAGVGYDFTENLNAFVGYRLFGIPGQGFEALDTDFEADTLYVHSLQLGARYSF